MNDEVLEEEEEEKEEKEEKEERKEWIELRREEVRKVRECTFRRLC